MMKEQSTAEPIDALLLPFIQESDCLTAEHLLAQLIQEHADPIIAKILQRKLRVSLSASQGNRENQDALEIASGLRASLIAALRNMQQNPHQISITSFHSYVATKTYSACADYFRERNPERWRLKNLLRYQLNHHPQFALWKAENSHWYAGLSKWNRTNGSGSSTGPLPVGSEILQMCSARDGRDLPPQELLWAIFAKVQQPLQFDRLVSIAAEVWNITDSPIASFDNPDHERQALVKSSPGIDVLLEQRLYLQSVWTEVCRLPVLQRAALLLNLRDAQGGSAIFFIPHLGIATKKQISEMLEVTEEEFGALWNDLPLNDLRIAQRLGITRQQVINLRKTARERLARRIEKNEGDGSGATVDSKKPRKFTA
jgi:hypothetical protein